MDDCGVTPTTDGRRVVLWSRQGARVLLHAFEPTDATRTVFTLPDGCTLPPTA